MMSEINADVEAIVIPVGLMVAAPLAVLIHPGPVMLNLTALLAVALCIAIDASPIRFQPSVAFVFFVGAGGVSKGKRQPTRQRASQCESSPDSAVFHGRLRNIMNNGLFAARTGLPIATAPILGAMGWTSHRGKAAVCRQGCLTG